MMQMLEAAGLPLLTDAKRPADPDNPRGFYEFEPVKRLATDASFLPRAVGRAVKVVAPLLPALPRSYDYRIVFVERPLAEVLASQHAMLVRLGADSSVMAEQAMAKAFERSLHRVKQWIAAEAGVRACFVSHAEMVESPERSARSVLRFLASDATSQDLFGHDLADAAGNTSIEMAVEVGSERIEDVDHAVERRRRLREDRTVERMASVSEQALYRQRGSDAT